MLYVVGQCVISLNRAHSNQQHLNMIEANHTDAKVPNFNCAWA